MDRPYRRAYHLWAWEITGSGTVLTKNYSEFREKLLESNCQLCGLSASRTRLVVDRGNPKATAFFIGEAPGANEDLEGKAFVGRSGRLLDSLLAEIGFDTNQDALIANVVKCRPPDNRRPEPEEAKTCLPFLKKQIQLVNPRLILLLGATALKYFVPEKKSKPMSEQVGRFFAQTETPGVLWMTIYHPAFILRDPRKKDLMREHLKTFVHEWKKTKPAKTLIRERDPGLEA